MNNPYSLPGPSPIIKEEEFKSSLTPKHQELLKRLQKLFPECCIEGKQLRARGQGFNVDGYGKGDYILIVNTKPQSKLSKEEKNLLEKIKDLNK